MIYYKCFKEFINETQGLNPSVSKYKLGVEKGYELLYSIEPTRIKIKDYIKDLKHSWGVRIKFFHFKNYLILFGLFKDNNKTEVHFYNLSLDNNEVNIKRDVNKEKTFSILFSTIMSIIYYELFLKKPNEILYINLDELSNKRKDFYKSIINKINKKYNFIKSVKTQNNNLVIEFYNSYNKDLQESILVENIKIKERNLKELR